MSAQGLPINLLAQFVPRPPPEFERPIRPCFRVDPSPIGALVDLFEVETPPPREPFESPLERRNRIKAEKKLFHEQEVELLKQQYKPDENPNSTSDAFKTLFVGRLDFATTERTLRRVFEEWGRTKDVKIVCGPDGKSRGYGFVEYEDEGDLKDAYKHADGIRIDGRPVLVDVERGRTVPGWLPRRLGVGRGPGRVGFDPKQKKKRAPAAQPLRSNFSGGSKRPRSPPRGDYRRNDRQENNYRGSRDTSRRSSFNY